VLGCYYLTKAKRRREGRGARLRQHRRRDAGARGRGGRDADADPAAVHRPLLDLTVARDDQAVLHTPSSRTSPTRSSTRPSAACIFNDALPSEMPFVNGLLKKKGLQQVVQYCHLHFGLEKTVEMLDSLKNLGFTYATRSGCRSASTT
jgi:DNA-directed RNA polymerase subunit beta'